MKSLVRKKEEGSMRVNASVPVSKHRSLQDSGETLFDVQYVQAGTADPTPVAGSRIDVFDVNVLNIVDNDLYSLVRGSAGVYDLVITFSSIDAVVGDFRLEIDNNSDIARILRAGYGWNNTTKAFTAVINSMDAAAAAADIGGVFAVRIRLIGSKPTTYSAPAS